MMVKFVVLLICALCASVIANTETKTVSVTFDKSNNLSDYVKKLPQNVYNAFLGSLHSIEFNDKFMNEFMDDYLYTVLYNVM